MHEFLLIRLEIESDGETESIGPVGISIIPRIGETVECDYLHGSKITFNVTDIHHHLSSIGEDVLQQITIRGSEN